MMKAIDIVVNLFGPEQVKSGQTGFDAGFMDQVRMPDSLRGGVTPEDYLRIMDEAGIEHSLLIAVRAGARGWDKSFAIPYADVAAVCARYPDRFSGLAGIDPTLGMEQLRDLAHAVNELGFVGAHFYPHWFRMPPDAAQMYPVYAKCCELGVPLMLQVGQNLIYQKDVRLPSVARPILLDQVAIDFPELKLIGIHIGVPWTDEMIAMAWKHANVFIGGDAYAPRYWPQSLLDFIRGTGREKVLFGTDWPVIDPRRATKEVADMEFDPESRAALMRGNALRVFAAISKERPS
jgi:uncharacterized protein